LSGGWLQFWSTLEEGKGDLAVRARRDCEKEKKQFPFIPAFIIKKGRVRRSGSNYTSVA
jgi:hypothetical protein